MGHGVSMCLLVAAAAVVVRAFFGVIIQLVKQFCSRRRKLTDFGKWAVITGSTDGIGKETALLLVKSGLSVLLIGRSQEKLDETVKQASQHCTAGAEVRSLLIDFEKPDYELISKTLVLLDVGILVNNVGMSYPSAQYFSEISSQFIDQLIEVNLRSTMRMTHLVYEDMVKRRRGAIICVGSGASVLPSEPLYAGYAAVKGGIEAFCRSLQVEAAEGGVLVQCHTPLLVSTKLSKIRNPSATVPSAAAYAKNAVEAMQRGCKCGNPTMSPYLGHAAMLAAISLIPRSFWNWFRFRATKQIRSRYMKKLQEKAR